MDIPVELVGSNKATTTLCFSVIIKSSGAVKTSLDSEYNRIYSNIIKKEESLGQICVKVNDLIFFLREVPELKILKYNESTQECTYFLAQYGKNIEELGTFSNDKPLVLEIIKKSK